MNTGIMMLHQTQTECLNIQANKIDIKVDDEELTVEMNSDSDNESPLILEPDETAQSSNDDAASADAGDDAATEEEVNNDDDDDEGSRDESEYADFVEFVDFLDFLEAAPPTPKEPADVSADFLDFLKSTPTPEQVARIAAEEDALAKDDWETLLDDDDDASSVGDISWRGIVEGMSKTDLGGGDKEDGDSLSNFIDSLAKKDERSTSDDANKEADFAAFLQFFNSLPTDVNNFNCLPSASVGNKESAEAIWSNIVQGMYDIRNMKGGQQLMMNKDGTLEEIPQSWFGYFCDVFTQSFVKVQPEEGLRAQQEAMV